MSITIRTVGIFWKIQELQIKYLTNFKNNLFWKKIKQESGNVHCDKIEILVFISSTPALVPYLKAYM